MARPRSSLNSDSLSAKSGAFSRQSLPNPIWQTEETLSEQIVVEPTSEDEPSDQEHQLAGVMAAYLAALAIEELSQTQQ